ncbi:hypothetical protein D9Q98_001007 [Chlorella vulgaris]|uniref:Uncharacterized protein n=1 Tax=Chlorella vulgaris TaxID=3077 RepID=A0A9D4TZE9_CHLVU|nr:hypothetical protein D9Q98_001007 [Chlorella vulgaris]
MATAHLVEARYHDVYGINMSALEDILVEANLRLVEPLVVRSQPKHGVKAANVISARALRPVMKLYTLLAGVLPDDAVQWQIAPRLLLQDCFVDFRHSDCAARLMLMEGMMELLQSLHRRGLCVKSTCHAITCAVAVLARELHETSDLLSEVLDALQGSLLKLPSQDRHIGAYVYDMQERSRGVGIVYSRLEANYRVVEDILRICLVQCMAAARLLGYNAGHLLDPNMMKLLLGTDRSVPRDVKRATLALVFTVLSFTSDANEQQHSMDVSVHETNRRREQREHLSQVVACELSPLLETLLSIEYPLWQLSTAALAGTVGSSATTGLASGPPTGAGAGGDNLGQEVMTALGRAYAYLLECKKMTWSAFEAAILRPYTSPTSFWQLSNRMYRCLSMALLADTLRYAPSNLADQRDLRACTWMLKHWVLSLLDRGRRFTTGESLVVALSKQAVFTRLFTGLQPAELAIGNDGSAERTACLLGTVFGRLCTDVSWQPLLDELLSGMDELLERRDKETAGSNIQTKLHQDFARAEGQAEFSAEGLLRSRADVRQSLQNSPFGDLRKLWSVLIAWGAPCAFAQETDVLKPMWTVVNCTLELCSGNVVPQPFDDVVLEQFADSLRCGDRSSQPSGGLQQLREYLLSTFIRHSLSRSHYEHAKMQRTAVNAVRFLQAVLESMHGTVKADAEAVLLPLLVSLLSTLWPLEDHATPSLAVREAIHRMLAKALDELSSQHGQQLGMLLRSGANGCSSKRTSCKLRPADFCSTAALTALKLVAALLQAGEAEAAAQRARSLCQPSMTAADAAETDWQHLPPGHQWALACVPALSMLVVLGKDAAEPLKAPYVHFQNVMLSALPHQISRLTRRIAQQYGHPLAADGPLASSVACNSSKGTSHLPRQSLPTIDQEVLPLQAGTSLACQQTTLAAQKSHGSQRCGRPDAHDVDFKAIHLLKQQHRLTTVGLLTKRPEVKANGKSSALRLELWDHQGAKLVVVVPFQHALFQQLQQEANQRLDSGVTILRIIDAMLLTAAGAAAGSSAKSYASCTLRHSSSVEWEPSCERAEKIKRACASGRLQPPRQEKQHQQQGTPQPPLAHPAQCLQPQAMWNEQTQRLGTYFKGGGSSEPVGAAASQAAPQQQDAGISGWHAFALQVAALCKPGLQGRQVIEALMDLAKQPGCSKHQLMVRGAPAVAARVQSELA